MTAEEYKRLEIVAIHCIEEEQYNEAMTHLFHLATMGSETAFTYLCMGFIYGIYQEYEKAIDMFEKALEIEPDSFNAHVGIGMAQENLNQQLKAKTSYKKAILIDRINFYDLFRNGVVCEQHGNTVDAIKSCEKEVLNNKNNIFANYQLASMYRKTGRDDLADEVCKRMTGLNPVTSDDYLCVGISNLDLLDYGNAIACFEKALEKDPWFISAYYNVAVAYLETGEKDAAWVCYQKALFVDKKAAEDIRSLILSHD